MQPTRARAVAAALVLAGAAALVQVAGPSAGATDPQLDRIDSNAYWACMNAAGADAANQAHCLRPPLPSPTPTPSAPTTSPAPVTTPAPTATPPPSSTPQPTTTSPAGHPGYVLPGEVGFLGGVATLTQYTKASGLVPTGCTR